MFSLAFLISFAVVFIRTIAMPGMLFSAIGKVVHHWPSIIKKPLLTCIVCMVPWYGAIIYFGLFRLANFTTFVCVILIAGGVNSIIDKYLEDE